MRKRKQNISTIGLDSLVDIVSNNVGILVILAIFMAIISIVSSPETKTKTEENVTESPKKIIIPWSHHSQKTSLLFVIRHNRLVYLDRTPIYQHMKKQLSTTRKPSTKVRLDSYDIELIPRSNYSHCLEFQTHSNAGYWWHQMIRGQGLLTQLLQQYPPSEFYYFFWVDTDSFELFKEIRQYLRDLNFEVGWKPITSRSPLLYCTGASRSLSFQPQ